MINSLKVEKRVCCPDSYGLQLRYVLCAALTITFLASVVLSIFLGCVIF